MSLPVTSIDRLIFSIRTNILYRSKAKSYGYGLVETLISLLLATLMTITIIQQYLNIKQQLMRVTSTLQASFELDWVSDQMRSSIHRAGFTPCGNLDRLISSDPRIRAIDTNHHLQMQRMDDKYAHGIEVLNATTLLVAENPKLNAQFPILVADCFHAEAHKIQGIERSLKQQVVHLTKPLIFTYQTPFYVGEWIQETYFTHSSGGLFYQNHHSDELTSQVNALSTNRRHSLLQVTLYLKNKQQISIAAMVRSP